jgi:hypothetical protein
MSARQTFLGGRLFARVTCKVLLVLSGLLLHPEHLTGAVMVG